MTDFGVPVSQISGMALEKAPSVSLVEGNIYILLNTSPSKLVKLDRNSLDIINEYTFATGEADIPYNSFFVHEGKLYVCLNATPGPDYSRIAVINLPTMTRLGTILISGIAAAADTFSQNGAVKYGNVGYIGVSRSGSGGNNKIYQIDLTTDTEFGTPVNLAFTGPQACLAITSNGGYIIASGSGSTRPIKRVNTSTLLVDGSSTFSSSTGQPTCLFIESNNNYIYAAGNTITVHKLAINGIFRNILSFTVHQYTGWGGTFDLYNRNLLLGADSVGEIFKIDISTNQQVNFKDTGISQNIISGITMLDHSYWCYFTSPAKIIKIRNDDLSIIDLVTLPTGYNLSAGIFVYS